MLIYSCYDETEKTQLSAKRDTLSTDSLVRLGGYLTTIIGCNDCHTPKKMLDNGMMVLDSALLLSGYPSSRGLPKFPDQPVEAGFVVGNLDATSTYGPWGTSFAANLTSDDTGIGKWSLSQFSIALQHGQYRGIKGTRMLQPTMPWPNFKHMSAIDVKAIYEYLKSTKPVVNIVPAFKPAKKHGDEI